MQAVLRTAQSEKKNIEAKIPYLKYQRGVLL